MSYWDRERIAFADLIGKTLLSVEKTDATMTFKVDDGSEYEMYHDQDCCESVYIESVVDDLDDLVGEPILVAEEVTSGDDPVDYKSESTYRERFTWTFYKLATRKGYVDLRWLGGSNGYYSESVSFARTVEPSS